MSLLNDFGPVFNHLDSVAIPRKVLLLNPQDREPRGEQIDWD